MAANLAAAGPWAVRTVEVETVRVAQMVGRAAPREAMAQMEVAADVQGGLVGWCHLHPPPHPQHVLCAYVLIVLCAYS